MQNTLKIHQSFRRIFLIILVGGKEIFWSEWLKKSIISIKDLLDETGNLLTFQAFSLKPVFYNIIKCSEPFLSTWILSIAK